MGYRDGWSVLWSSLASIHVAGVNMFRKWLGLDKVDELLEIERREQRSVTKTSKELDRFMEQFDKQIKVQNKKLDKIDVIYDAVHNNEIDGLLKQLEKSLKVLDNVKYMDESIRESEGRICSKIDTKFEVIDQHLIESVERMSQMRFKIVELRKYLLDARKKLEKKDIFVEELEVAMERTLEPQELEVLETITRAGEIDVHDLSATLSKSKETVEKNLKTLVELGMIDADNLGRRILFKPRRLMAYN